jgi:hypothetical protein
MWGTELTFFISLTLTYTDCLEGHIHRKLNCGEKLHEKLNWMFSGTAQVFHQICQFFFVSSVCLMVRVTTVDKNKAVVCCLLATSAIMLSGKKKRKPKMWSKKWYLKSNISYDCRLSFIHFGSRVPWDDAIVVLAGKLRKLWDSRSELRSSLCERRLERTIMRSAWQPSNNLFYLAIGWKISCCYAKITQNFIAFSSI